MRGKIASPKDLDNAYLKAEKTLPPNSHRSDLVEEAKRTLAKQGFTGAQWRGIDGVEVVVFDPKNIRRTDAAFDPAQSGSS